MIKHLNGTEPIPDRPGDVVLCMQINQEAREAYWGVYPSEERPDRVLQTATRDEDDAIGGPNPHRSNHAVMCFYADCGARTHDLGINSPTLHQLS